MIGGDPTLVELKAQNLKVKGERSLFPESKQRHQVLSFATATMILYKAACAEDAYCMITSYDSGLILALVSMIIMFFLTQGSHHLFLRTWSFGEAYSYEEVWRATIGPRFAWFPGLCIIIAYFTAMITGFWEAMSFGPNAVAAAFTEVPDVLLNPWLWQYVLLVCFSLPCLFSGHISAFRLPAWVGLVVTMVAVVCLGIHAFRQQPGGGFVFDNQVPLATWDFSLIHGVLNSFNVAFFAHPFVATVARAMERPTHARILGMTYLANVLCGICVYLIPAFGYLTMAEIEDGDNVFHYLDQTAPEVIVGQFAVVVSMVCSTALFSFFTVKTIVELFVPQARDIRVPMAFTILGIGAMSISVNFTGDMAISIVYAVGAIGFSLLGFVLPPIYFFAQYRLKSLPWSLLSFIILFVGGGMMLITLVLTIRDIIEL
jgi:hypothetical protein